MNTVEFGKFVAELRKEKSMTQKQLADSLCVTDKAVSRWETGKNYPDIETLEMLASVLGVTLSELLEHKKIPDEEIIGVSEKNVSKQMKNNRKSKKKLVAAVVALIIVICILAGVLLKINGYFDGVIYHNIDAYSDDILTVLNNAQGYIRTRPKAKGDYTVQSFDIIMTEDKTASYIHLDGVTENGRYFYVSTLFGQEKPNEDYCFIGEFRENRGDLTGRMSLLDLKRLITLLDFSDFGDERKAGNCYSLGTTTAVDLQNSAIADRAETRGVIYCYNNNGLKEMGKSDVLSGKYLVIDLWSVGDENEVGLGHSIATIYYEL